MSSAARTPEPGATMTVEEFVSWHADQPETERYELVDGRPVLMAAQRLAHAVAKRRAADALDAAAAPTSAVPWCA